jgi:hypothetical protein
MCPSSGEMSVSIRYLVFFNLCGWPSDMQGGMQLHTRRSSTQIDKYQVSYWYTYFSWWWAHSCPKRVENRNKCTKKELCTRLVLFARLYFSFVTNICVSFCHLYWKGGILHIIKSKDLFSLIHRTVELQCCSCMKYQVCTFILYTKAHAAYKGLKSTPLLVQHW